MLRCSTARLYSGDSLHRPARGGGKGRGGKGRGGNTNGVLAEGQ